MERASSIGARVAGGRFDLPSQVGTSGLTREQMVATLMPLAVALGKEMDLPSWSVYWKTLSDVSPVVLDSAATEWGKSGERFFPKPGELRALCSKTRSAMVAAVPFQSCETCATSPGWARVLVDGVERLERCQCWRAHRQQLRSLGVGSPVPVAQLTAGDGE